jgi:cytochrome c5
MKLFDIKRGDWIALGCAALVVVALAFWPQDGKREERGKRVAEMAEAWSGEIAFAASYDALAPSGEKAADVATPASSFDVSDPYSGLPRNEGYELVAGFCSGCHSMQIVMQQRHDARAWNTLLDWMETQGMPAPAPDERATLVAYLARNFGDQAAGAP